MATFPTINKKQAYFYLNCFPRQSTKVIHAVRKRLDKIKEKDFDFNHFMNGLFWSNDIILKMGYYHYKVQLQKANLLKY